MTDQDQLKKQTAEAALKYIEGGVVGVGTGSTVNFFIDALAQIKNRISGAVSSSDASTARLQANGIRVLDLNSVDRLSVYVDGTDETNHKLQLIKGGGGALTREKIVAQASNRFICIADQSKLVDVLGTFPLPIEVIPMACGQVEQVLLRHGGQPILREDFVTDNGNFILDIHGLHIPDPVRLEAELNAIPGVVTNGIFASRSAHVLLLGTTEGVRELQYNGPE